MSVPTVSQIRADFDRLARLGADGWDHSRQHHAFLLARVPQPCREALEIGCGAGAFSHALAGRADGVLALDLSPEMIRLARARAPKRANLEFQLADASSWPFPSERFDCIASIATLHHLDPRALLPRLRDPKAVREAWEEHGRGETYLRISEVREICRDLLPGAEVRRHLLWRYSIVWRKPGAESDAGGENLTISRSLQRASSRNRTG